MAVHYDALWLMNKKYNLREYTLILIKPDALAHSGKIIDRILEEGFSMRALKLLKFSLEDAQKFYAIHKDRPFFKEFTSYMSSGPVIAACIERENAVSHWRKIIGDTDPSQAEEGTIRKQFGRSIGENAVHGSDSVENAKIESAFLFSGLEII